jgi:hypothetical protein
MSSDFHPCLAVPIFHSPGSDFSTLLENGQARCLRQRKEVFRKTDIMYTDHNGYNRDQVSAAAN